MRTITLIFGMVVVILACGVAQAGFISFGCYFPEDPYEYDHQWDYDFANSRLTVTEKLLSKPAAGGDQLEITGVTDAGSTFTLVKTITNVTGETWTGYDLELISNTTFIDGTAGSTKFGSSSFSDDFKIVHFDAPQLVLSGEVVTLQVDIRVPTVGLFDFTIAQHPLPEPTSIMLLGIGVLLLRKRKHNL